MEREFVVTSKRGELPFPFKKASPRPSATDPVVETEVDDDLGREAFRYRLASGAIGFVHIDEVLEFHGDAAYTRAMLLYHLTIEAERRLSECAISEHTAARRLRMSTTELARLLDATNVDKTADQMFALLRILECDEFTGVSRMAAAAPSLRHA